MQPIWLLRYWAEQIISHGAEYKPPLINKKTYRRLKKELSKFAKQASDAGMQATLSFTNAGADGGFVELEAAVVGRPGTRCAGKTLRLVANVSNDDYPVCPWASVLTVRPTLRSITTDYDCWLFMPALMSRIMFPSFESILVARLVHYYGKLH